MIKDNIITAVLTFWEKRSEDCKTTWYASVVLSKIPHSFRLVGNKEKKNNCPLEIIIKILFVKC